MKLIRRTKEKVEGVKRQYFPYIVMDKCPECGVEASVDLMEQYLSDPVFGEEEDVYFFCSACEHEWERKVIPNLVIELPSEKKGSDQ